MKYRCLVKQLMRGLGKYGWFAPKSRYYIYFIKTEKFKRNLKLNSLMIIYL